MNKFLHAHFSQGSRPKGWGVNNQQQLFVVRASSLTGAMKERRERILLSTGGFEPGVKGGGPIRSIVNLIRLMTGDFDFYVVTNDRDLGDRHTYSNVRLGEWLQWEDSKVMYLPKGKQTIRHWQTLIRETQPDLIYLNSLFASRFTLAPLLAARSLRRSRDVLIAPRGELNPGALAIKAWKKQVFLQLSAMLGLYEGVRWHATSQEEGQLIKSRFGRRKINIKMNVALDTPNVFDRNQSHPAAVKEVGKIKILFVSRISRIKNLDLALRVLQGIEGKVEFDIYGPIEDTSYWRVCSKMIPLLPPQVNVKYGGLLDNRVLLCKLGEYHLLFLPSGGENFGHAIFEALSHGVPVLISDKTPWKGLEGSGAGWDLPLQDTDAFRRAICQVLEWDQDEFNQASESALRLVAQKFSVSSLRDQYRHMLGDRGECPESRWQ